MHQFSILDVIEVHSFFFVCKNSDLLQTPVVSRPRDWVVLFPCGEPRPCLRPVTRPGTVCPRQTWTTFNLHPRCEFKWRLVLRELLFTTRRITEAKNLQQHLAQDFQIFVFFISPCTETAWRDKPVSCGQICWPCRVACNMCTAQAICHWGDDGVNILSSSWQGNLKLEQIIRHHIVQGRELLVEDLLSVGKFKTAANQFVEVSVNDEVTFNATLEIVESNSHALCGLSDSYCHGGCCHCYCGQHQTLYPTQTSVKGYASLDHATRMILTHSRPDWLQHRWPHGPDDGTMPLLLLKCNQQRKSGH